MDRIMKYCCPDGEQVVHQPVENEARRELEEHEVNTIGMNIIIRCWAGSAAPA